MNGPSRLSSTRLALLLIPLVGVACEPELASRSQTQDQVDVEDDVDVNLLSNGSFESLSGDATPSDWQIFDDNPSGQIEIDPELASDGSNSLLWEVEALDGGWEYFIVQDLDPGAVLAGQSYRLRGSYRARYSGELEVNVVLRGDDEDWGTLWESDLPPSTAWADFSYLFTAPASTTEFMVDVIKVDDESLELWVDDLVLEAVD